MIIKDFTRGLWKENPVFVQVLGMCPTLAVTTKALFGLSMGMATTFVVISSSVVISLIRNIWHSDFVQNQLWDVWAIVYDLLA